VDYNFGLFEFYGKPYIDLRVSFNSFTPDSLSPGISDKLIDFYIQKLMDNPHFHDKVEFDVVLTAYDFNLEKRFDELLEAGFSKDEIKEISESLRLHTKKILESDHLKSLEDDMRTLNEKRNRIVGSDFSTIEKIYFLTRDCKKFGTFQFSIIARYAFIGNILLKSLVGKNVISKSRMDDFFESLETIPKMLLKDKKILDNGQLKEKYGHLRPGTYDIESFSYKENIQLLGAGDSGNDVSEDGSVFEWTEEEKQVIDANLRESGFDISFEKFMDFSRTSIEFREHSKFNFTNNLSLVLDLIVDFCSEYGISRADASYLSIDDILQYYGSTLSFNIEGELRDKIRYNKRFNFITKSLKLPDLIFSENDVDFFMINESKPNYITENKMVASVHSLDSGRQERAALEGKIVLIEKADPGYDWIFSCNISGLITKYGGVASHMAIRAAELGLPAAIGCGELIFNQAKNSNVIELDCNAQQIKRIN
jgi:phosphohistidine swiveling domain-containing protein